MRVENNLLIERDRIIYEYNSLCLKLNDLNEISTIDYLSLMSKIKFIKGKKLKKYGLMNEEYQNVIDEIKRAKKKLQIEIDKQNKINMSKKNTDSLLLFSIMGIIMFILFYWYVIPVIPMVLVLVKMMFDSIMSFIMSLK